MARNQERGISPTPHPSLTEGHSLGRNFLPLQPSCAQRNAGSHPVAHGFSTGDATDGVRPGDVSGVLATLPNKPERMDQGNTPKRVGLKERRGGEEGQASILK